MHHSRVLSLFWALGLGCHGCGDDGAGGDGTTGASQGSSTSTDGETAADDTDAPTSSTGTTQPVTGGQTMGTTDEPTTGSTGEPGTTGTTDPGATDTASTGPVGACTPGATQACFSGPPEAQDVGLCAAGEQLCTPEGEWAACVGEVLPATETCVTPGDEDCDGVDACAGTGEYAWDHTFGGAGNEAYAGGRCVEFDGAGNLVLSAVANGDVDLGGGTLVGAGKQDIVLAKFAPDGAHLWSKRFGDAAEQLIGDCGLTVDAAGEVVLAGDFQGTVDFGGGPLSAKGKRTLFLAKFAADGAHVWSEAFTTGQDATVGDVARDAAGNIVLGGYFNQSLDLGGGALVSAGMLDAFVGKFGPDGEHLWSRRFGDAQSQYVLGLGVDYAGEVYIGGGFSGTIDPGNGALLSAGDTDVFVAHLDPQGNAVWGKRFGDPAAQDVRGLAVDPSGRVVITGRTHGPLDFGGGPLDVPDFRSFLAQFDSDGGHRWSRLVATGSVLGDEVAYDGLGQIVVTGWLGDPADFGGGELVPLGIADIYALKVDGAGAHVWSKRFGAGWSDTGYGIAGSATGRVAVTGDFGETVDFGGGPRVNMGSWDGFLVVFDP